MVRIWSINILVSRPAMTTSGLKDGRLGAGRGRQDGHRGPGVLLDADDQPKTPAPLMTAVGIDQVYRVNRAADHA